MKTDTKELAAELRQYNAWRLGDWAKPMPEPQEITRLIDAAADRLEELERELLALYKTADKLEEDKESNARLCESLRADWENERALADRLAGELQWWGDYCGDNAPASIDLALDAWKEARGDS